MGISSDTLKLIQQSRHEARIEDLLFAYPHLISPELRRPLRQRWLSASSRTDLIFEERDRIVVVEIKRSAITVGAIRQLDRYKNELSLKGKKFLGIAVGKSLHSAAATLLSGKGSPHLYRQLGRDIPLKIVVCHLCRQARSAALIKCPTDGETETI